MGQGFGIDIRSSRVNSTSQCRQRGDAVVRGEIVMLDLAGSDALTSAYTEGTKGSVGTQSTASSPLATVLPATTGLTAGRVGVAIAATADNQLGRYEFGEHGDGSVTDVIVEALVKVGAANVEGAALRVGTITLSDALGGVTAVLDAAADGGTFATLLEDATTDDKGGPATTANYKRVILHSAGKADASGDETEEQKRMRFAVTSGMGAASTAGAFAFGNWAPSTDGAEDFTLGFVAASTISHSGTVRVIGSVSADHANVGVGAADSARKGDVIVYNNSTPLLTVTDAFTYDGLPQDVTARVTPTTIAVYVDGVLVGSATTATQNWSNVAAVHYVGAGASTSSNRFPGTVFNARFLDHKDANNNVWLNLDEPSGNFINAYLVATDPLYNVSTTAVLAFVRNGFDRMTAVVSTDGRGMPWQSQGPLFYHAQHGSTQVLDGGVAAFVSLQFTTAETDPTGSFTLNSASFFAAPCAGTAVVTLCGVYDANADPADSISIELRNSGTPFYSLSVEGGALSEARSYSMTGITAMTAGQTLGALFNNAAATTTLTLRNHAVTIEFYPTPVAG